MNQTKTSQSNQPSFLGQNSRSDLITKLTLLSTLLFIYLVPWGDKLWDGTPKIVAVLSTSLALVLFLFHGASRNFSFFHFFVILYNAWLLISLLWSPDIKWGSEVATTSVQLLFLVFLFTLVIDNKRKINFAYQAYVLGNITGSCIITYNYLNGIESIYWGRYGIVNIETDELSIFLALSIPMAAYLATQYKAPFWKILNLVAIPLVFFAIFLTGTRTGSIVGVIGILYWLFTYRKSSIIIKLAISAVMVSSIVAIFTFAPKASVDRVFSAGKSLSSGTLNSRSYIWRGSIEQWKQAPILGAGLGGLGYALSKEHVNYEFAHNAFIHLLTENGIIGLSLYLLIIISLLFYAINTPMNEKSFLISLLMVTLMSQLTTHTQNQKIIWFVFTMIAIHAHMYSYLDKRR